MKGHASRAESKGNKKKLPMTFSYQLVHAQERLALITLINVIYTTIKVTSEQNDMSLIVYFRPVLSSGNNIRQLKQKTTHCLLFLLQELLATSASKNSSASFPCKNPCIPSCPRELTKRDLVLSSPEELELLLVKGGICWLISRSLVAAVSSHPLPSLQNIG